MLYACLISTNFNKYIHTLIKQICDGSASHTLYICEMRRCQFVYLGLVLDIPGWVLDIPDRR